MRVVVLFLLFLHVQGQAQEELSRDGIRCIMQSRGKTALERWLECLKPISIAESSEDSKIPILDSETEKPSVDWGGAGQDTSFNDNVEGKGRGDGDSNSTAIGSWDFETAEEVITSHLQNGETATHEMREMEEGDALSGWLKLNLGVLALVKLLILMASGCRRKKTKSKSIVCLQDDSMASAPVSRKAVVDDDTLSKQHAGTAYPGTLGGPLGSAIGAVFAEVILTTCSSGSPVPADKISMLLEIAMKESLVLVAKGAGCSGLVEDFMASFTSTYKTIYRIHQACSEYLGAAYEGSRETNSMHPQSEHGRSSNLTHTWSYATKKHSSSTNLNELMNHTVNTNPSNDGWQVEHEVPLHFYSHDGKQDKSESSSLLSVDDVLDKPGNLNVLADHGESDSTGRVHNLENRDTCSTVEDDVVSEQNDALVTSTVHYHNSSLAKQAVGHRSVEHRQVKSEEEEKIPSLLGNEDDLEQTSCNSEVKMNGKEAVAELDYQVDHANSVCEEVSSIMQSNTIGMLDAVALVCQTYGAAHSDFQKVFLNFLERHVQAQEQHNQIKSVEVAHLIKQLILEEEKIQLTSASNDLMRENIELNRSKANFKESTVLEQRANAAHVSFSTTCADELVAGLFVMLISLVHGARKYSFVLLNDLVSTCQPSVKEPRRSSLFHIDWLYNSLDSLVEKLQAFVCHITVAGRILIGSIVVAVVASSLLRRSITSSSQSMPATILIIILGGVCGFAGKLAVDTIGGSGIRWLVAWEIFCMLHALTNCFTPSVYSVLHGSPSSTRAKFGIPFWFRRLSFHIIMVLVLPVLAGQLPFGSFRHITNDLFLTSVEILSAVFFSFSEWLAQLI